MVTGITQPTGLTGKRALRAILLAGVATSLFVAGAQAQVTVDDDRTTPIATATASGGNPADVTISTDGSITLDDGGTAVTVNSDNDLTMLGDLVLGHVDDAIGVLIEPGNEGDIIIGGNILMERTEAQQEANADEDVTDYADNRYGLLLQAGGTHTGDISFSSSGAIRLYGDNSVGIDLSGALDGDLAIAGDFTVGGVNAVGLAIRDTVTGDVTINSSSISFVGGSGATGYLIDGDIEGRLLHAGSITVTGYFDSTVDAEDDPDNNNDEQAALQSGSAIDLSGDVDGGFLIQGPVPVSDQPADYSAPATASVLVDGSAPALFIHGGAVLGELDTSDFGADYGAWGFVNRGNITARGLYSQVDATGARIEEATIFGGIRNDGTVRASSYNGDATALHLGNITLDTLRNAGSIQAVSNADDASLGTVNATALLIDADATLPSLRNDLRIEAVVTADNGNAIAIKDESGTLTEIVNSGGIFANVVDFADDEGEEPTGDAIAIDVSANTSGVTIRNTVSDSFDDENGNRANFGQVRGDILFGSGDNSYLADAGVTQGDIFFQGGNDTVSLSQTARMFGDIDFGMGADIFTLDNANFIGNAEFGGGMDVLNILGGGFFSGDITDSDGMLDITVSGGSTFYETGGEDTTISNLFIGSASTLGIGISENGTGATSFLVSDTATFENGATIQPVFIGGAVETISAEIVIANILNVDPTQLVIGDSEGNTPYLFNITFDTTTDATAGTESLILNVQRRTAEELGLQEGLAPAYVPTLEALATDDDLGPLVLNFTQEADFRDALSQLLAGPLDAPLAYARAQNNSVTSIITQRLDLARNAGAYPRTFWIQEEIYFLNRGSDEVSNGFDGGGFSLAAGVDAGLDNYVDAVGLSVSLSSAKYDEKKGGDFPFERLTYGVGAYAAFSAGPIQLDTRAEYAVSDSESERNISIGDVDRTAFGEWEGSQIAASARVRYSAEMLGITTEPFVSADFISITEDAYEETGGGNGVDLAVDERTHESLRANVGLRVGKVFQMQPSIYDTGIPGTIHPQLTVAWSQELNDDPLEADYQYLSGGDEFTLFTDPEEGAAIVGADVAYENEYAKLHLGVSGTIGETTEAVILRAGVGLKW
ncbi:autotransporter outer membrane beta-barrel domain-containing protein [Aquisalinus flavus]|uniref:Autotransporter n=1 Tax=Aquisalinus flavus TaxID=1526572 RepID=A0A8J2V3H9_9PROT|nr:autotransporter outer membrane beta-barrel domain-containing protein [Aquisalinus flavus]MBD0425416.1 autotransporter domain-containing protein [Aquisalinus flavus]UNE48942.1 autotransporter domain-containing protein [Aquisalinus flavus]GGD16249.1 autotransporter [Aquisalinus flavus]